MSIKTTMTGLWKWMREKNVVWYGGVILLLVLAVLFLGPRKTSDPPISRHTATIYHPDLREEVLEPEEKDFKTRTIERIKYVEVKPDTVYIGLPVREDGTELLGTGPLYDWGMLEVTKEGRTLRVDEAEPREGGEVRRKVFTLPAGDSDYRLRANEASSRLTVGRVDSWGVRFGVAASMSLGFNNTSAVGVGVIQGPVSLRRSNTSVSPSVIGTTDGDYGVGVSVNMNFFGGL